MSTPERPPLWPNLSADPGQPPPPGSGVPAGPPPPGYAPPAWPQAPEQRRTNRSAIASLVLGILTPCAVITGILSVIFGIVALARIKHTGEKGKGLAIGGLAATGAWLVIISLVVAAVVVYDSGPERDDSGQLTTEGSISVEDLSIGDCLGELPEDGHLFTVPGVPCGEPHHAQVYGTFDLPDGDWPGEEAVFVQADDACIDLLAAFPDAYDDPTVEVFYLYPTRTSWRAGDREVVCIAEYLDGARTGSMLS